MADVSLPTAELWYRIFNIVLYVGAVAVAIGTYGAIRMGSIKEHYGDQRIAKNESETAHAKAASDVAVAEAAKANERIAEANREAALANERAAEANKIAEGERVARLKLEAKLAPRSLSEDQSEAIVKQIRQYSPQEFEFASYQDDVEVKPLVMALIKVLVMAGWKGNKAREFLMGGLVTGVVVEFAPSRSGDVGMAGKALAEAVTASGVLAVASANVEMEVFPDRIRIKVGRKPQ